MRKKTTKANTRRAKKGAIKDLTPKADPKGGGFDSYLKIKGVVGEAVATQIPALNFHK
jgi:hypothetical protein